MNYSHIRRCSSCRLRRCFENQMREDLVRTNEENERYKRLIDLNRQKRRVLTEQRREIRDLSITRVSEPLISD
jgi:hypothetical protein